MRLSKGFWQTYKETPADAEIPSHQLMMRSGLIHKSGAGLYSYLPMGYRIVRKVEQIVREEMDRAGCHELLMSVVTPGDLWKESGRWDAMGSEMLTFKDKGDRDLCISPTNEESITDIFRKTVHSYKQLPLNLYQINTKFRDEIRPRFGLMRAREFTMKDAYSFHLDKACLDEVYDRMYEAYDAIIKRVGLEYFAVEADAGAMASGEAKTHEFQVVADTGEDELVYCSETGYAANIEKAQTVRGETSFDMKEQELKDVPTPGKSTIEDVCNFLKVPQSHSLKSLIYKSIVGEDEKFYLILLLGDDSLNEVKLKNHLGSDHLMPATDNELEKLGVKKGYIGPAKLDAEVMVLLDQQVKEDAFYCVGANKVDLHFTGMQPKRDMTDYTVVDLRLSTEGDLTLDGKHQISIRRGIEVGHIFQLGDKYTKSMDVTVLDQNGKAQHPLMGCYGIGVTRIVAAAIEQNHDEKGIVWPAAIAPYQVYFALIGKSEEFKELASEIYEELKGAGIEVIFDDRKAGPGFKFKDADLLGLPIRLVLGERDYKADGMLEIIERKSGESKKVSRDDVLKSIKELI